MSCFSPAFALPPPHLAARGGFENGRVIMSVPAPNPPLAAHCSKNKLTAPWPPHLSVHFFYPSLFLSHHIQATWASLLFLKQSQVGPAPGPLHFWWLLPSTLLTKLTACRPLYSLRSPSISSIPAVFLTSLCQWVLPTPITRKACFCSSKDLSAAFKLSQVFSCCCNCFLMENGNTHFPDTWLCFER